jgi:hypothetical protein
MSKLYQTLKIFLRSSKFRVLFAFSTILSLFIGYQLNLSYLILKARTNNFFDVLVSIPALILIAFFFYILIFINFKYQNLIRFYLAYSFLGLLIYIIFNDKLLSFTFLDIFSLFYKFLITSAIFVSWIYLVIESQHYLDNKIIPIILFILAGLFDHYVISDILVIIFTISLFTFFSVWSEASIIIKKSYLSLVLVYIISNILLGFYQIISGFDFGLKWMGEVSLSVTTIGVAKLEIMDQVYVRPYGLMTHPNLLGFLGLICFYFSKTSESKVNVINPKLPKILSISGLILIVLSFSRMALIGLILILIFTTVFDKKINFDNKWNFQIIFKLLKSKFYSFILVLVPVFLLILLFIQRLSGSDRYRFADFNQFIELIGVLEIHQIMFGTFVSSYQYLLRDNFVLEMWQYQPVHNLFLNFLIWTGIFPFLVIIGYLYFERTSVKLDSKKSNL